MTDDDPEEPQGPSPAQLLVRSKAAWALASTARIKMVQAKSPDAAGAFVKALREAQAVTLTLRKNLRCACGCAQ